MIFDDRAYERVRTYLRTAEFLTYANALQQHSVHLNGRTLNMLLTCLAAS